MECDTSLILEDEGLSKNVIKSPDSGHPNHQKSEQGLQGHQTRKQPPQKCDLVCPGQKPLALPANFLQNCTSTATNSSSSSKLTTTARPNVTKTTTESSEEEGNESEETETPENRTTRIGKQQKLNNRQGININHQKTKHRHQLKHKFRKETVMFKREAKSRLFKQHKHLEGKVRLDGCHVVCSEPNGSGGDTGNGGNPANNNGSDAEESGSDNSDSGDNYVDGEDSPIEIIYIPKQAEESKRPSEVYQINNYELIEPQPSFGFEYGPLILEDKQQQKMKKRMQHNRRKDDHKKSSDKKLQ